MKLLFVVYGAAWPAVCARCAVRPARSWRSMVALAVGSLWYLVIGTVLSAGALAVLAVPGVRRGPSTEDRR